MFAMEIYLDMALDNYPLNVQDGKSFWKKKSSNWLLAKTNRFNYIQRITSTLINLHIIKNLIICEKSCYKLHWTVEFVTLFLIGA